MTSRYVKAPVRQYRSSIAVLLKQLIDAHGEQVALDTIHALTLAVKGRTL